jgi:hypothetical protein
MPGTLNLPCHSRKVKIYGPCGDQGPCPGDEPAVSASRRRRLPVGPCDMFVEPVHFRADPAGVGVADLLEKCQCALPRGPCGFGITKGLVGVAEVRKGVSFVVTVAELEINVKGLLVARYGLRLVAEMTVSVAEAVPCLGLAETVSDVLLHVEGLLAVDEGLLVVAELSMEPAHRIE